MITRVTLHRYFHDWMELYKEGAVRDVTYRKYKMTHQQLLKICPKLKLCDLNRLSYQKLLNDYALTHERQTVMDFHRHLQSSIVDALEEGLLEKDPTRKAVIKGKEPGNHKTKYLNQRELQALLDNLKLEK